MRRHSDDAVLQKYFLKGLYLKIIGSIAFGAYHAYVYGGGDTFGFFLTGTSITKTLFSSPSDFFSLVFSPLSSINDLVDNTNWLWPDEIMWKSEANYFSARVASVLQLFTFQTYIATGILFSLISYWGIWKCFRFFVKLFPEYHKIIAISFLFFPTVVFWGSGLGKDSLTLGAVCGLTVSAYQIFLYKQRIVKNAFGVLLTCWVLFIIKPYVPLSFFMPLGLSLCLKYLNSIGNPILKIFMYPFLIVVIIGMGLFLNVYIQENFAQFSVDSITERIALSTTVLQQAGSAYDIGIDPESINGIGDMAPFFPKAVIASWYRPWLWEAKNPAMLLSAFEAGFVIILSLIIILRGAIIKTLYVIFSNAIMFSLFIYSFVFSGLIGLSTGNFGTLVRYKIPMLPFLIMVLLLTNEILKKKKPIDYSIKVD